MISRQQMEMSFDGHVSFVPAVRRSSRFNRARWWFNQMHALVDQAIDWKPAPPARPEQIYLTLARNRR